jgi:hypothetical protein
MNKDRLARIKAAQLLGAHRRLMAERGTTLAGYLEHYRRVTAHLEAPYSDERIAAIYESDRRHYEELEAGYLAKGGRQGKLEV